MSCSTITIRRPIAEDLARLTAELPLWWGGAPVPAFPSAEAFAACREASLIAEFEDLLIGVLVGSLPADLPGEARVLICGVRPVWRRAGLGRDLVGRFAARARARGRDVVRAAVPAGDAAAAAFFAALSFVATPVAAVAPAGEPLALLELALGAEATR